MVVLAMMLLSFGVTFRIAGIERSRRLGRGFFGDGLRWDGFLPKSGPSEFQTVKTSRYLPPWQRQAFWRLAEARPQSRQLFSWVALPYITKSSIRGVRVCRMLYRDIVNLRWHFKSRSFCVNTMRLKSSGNGVGNFRPHMKSSAAAEATIVPMR